MFNTELEKGMNQFPDGLGVRIPDSHSGGPGSIPGQGDIFCRILQTYTNKVLSNSLFDILGLEKLAHLNFAPRMIKWRVFTPFQRVGSFLREFKEKISNFR